MLNYRPDALMISYSQTELGILSNKKCYCDEVCVHEHSLYELINRSWTEIDSSKEFITYRSDEFILSAANNGEIEFISIDCPSYYVIVGVFRSHPFVETNEFRFDNSDGSGPGVIFDEEFDDVELIVINLVKYYHEFTRNKYH